MYAICINNCEEIKEGWLGRSIREKRYALTVSTVYDISPFEDYNNIDTEVLAYVVDDNGEFSTCPLALFKPLKPARKKRVMAGTILGDDGVYNLAEWTHE